MGCLELRGAQSVGFILTQQENNLWEMTSAEFELIVQRCKWLRRDRVGQLLNCFLPFLDGKGAVPTAKPRTQ